jgi:hypothetical protein
MKTATEIYGGDALTYTNAELTAAIDRTVATLSEQTQDAGWGGDTNGPDIHATRVHLNVLREEELRRALRP